MAIIGNTLIPLIIPDKDLYLIKEGVVQSGYTFKTTAIAYSSASNASHNSKATQQTGYIQVRSNASGATRGGSAYIGQDNLKSIIADYAYLNIKVRRVTQNNSNYYVRIGTYDYSKSGNYSSGKFCDQVTKQGGGADSSAVTLQIPITSATTGRSIVQVAFAFTTYISYSTGVDVYDVWLSK
jgi:hypothetical protein